MNKWTSLYPFNVENWCESLAQWTVTDARGSYKPCTSYAVIPISVHEATCLLRGFRSLLKPLERAVTRALPCRRFFKLSTRSPKDAWMVLSDAPEALAIHDDDDQHVQIEKLQKQQAFMGVRTFADVCNWYGRVSDCGRTCNCTWTTPRHRTRWPSSCKTGVRPRGSSTDASSKRDA
jgi:hypothetical protein